MSPELRTRLSGIAIDMHKQYDAIMRELPEGQLADESFSSIASMYVMLTTRLVHLNRDIELLKTTVEEDWS